MENNIFKPNDIDFYRQRFSAFGKSMQGCDYIPNLGIIKFILQKPDNPFTINLLQELFANNPKIIVDGFLTLVPFEKIQKEVSHGLSFQGNSYEDNRSLFLTSRKLLFWDIVEKALEGTPPDKCFEHKKPNGRGCLLGENWVMWGFCYILIKNNVGVLLSCGAWD